MRILTLLTSRSIRVSPNFPILFSSPIIRCTVQTIAFQEAIGAPMDILASQSATAVAFSKVKMRSN